MHDPILDSFLKRQQEEGLALASESDLVELTPLDGPPATRYHVCLRCRGLIRDEQGIVREADRFEALIWLGPNHLRAIDPALLVTWLGPRSAFHPNIAARAPFICLGPMRPGTRLVDLLHQIYEVVAGQRVTMREDDAMNGSACAWARRNKDRYPIDSRPLKWKAATSGAAPDARRAAP